MLKMPSITEILRRFFPEFRERAKAAGHVDSLAFAEKLADEFGAAAKGAFAAELGEAWQHTQSEIERILLPALASIEVPAFFDWGQQYPYPRPRVFGTAPTDPNALGKRHEFFGLYAQARLLNNRYRADFLFVVKVDGSPKVTQIVIECDGHDFHERTKLQAARDRQRDRVLTAAGYVVMHFTGSEIVRDPRRCANEVAAYIEGVYRAAQREAGYA